MKQSNYFGIIRNALRAVWTPKFFAALGVELIFLIASVGILTLGATLLFRELQRLLFASAQLTTAAAITSTAQAYTSFVSTVVVDGIALAVPLLILWVAARVGHQMIFQKWNKQSIVRAVISGFLYALLSVLAVLLALLVLNDDAKAYGAVIVFVVFAHFGWIHAVLSLRHKPIESIKKSFHIGVSKFHHLLIPYVLLALIVGILLTGASATGIVSALLYGILLSSIIAFSKIFLREILDLLH